MTSLMKFKVILLIVFCSSVLPGVSQVQSVSQSTSWLLFNQNIQLSSRWTVLADEQLAFAQENQSMQHVLRAGVSYNLPKGFSLVPLGYAYTWNYVYGKQPSAIVNNEHTIWQQLSFNHRVGRFGLSHRVRMEERFIENNQIDANGNLIDNGYSNYQDRIRYRLMTNVAVNKPTIVSGTLFINAWCEIFYGWGQAVQYHSINQKRAFIGAGYQINRNLTGLAGPYYQQLIKGSGNREENNFGYQIQMTYLINLSKKS